MNIKVEFYRKVRVKVFFSYTNVAEKSYVLFIFLFFAGGNLEILGMNVRYSRVCGTDSNFRFITY